MPLLPVVHSLPIHAQISPLCLKCLNGLGFPYISLLHEAFTLPDLALWYPLVRVLPVSSNSGEKPFHVVGCKSQNEIPVYIYATRDPMSITTALKTSLLIRLFHWFTGYITKI